MATQKRFNLGDIQHVADQGKEKQTTVRQQVESARKEERNIQKTVFFDAATNARINRVKERINEQRAAGKTSRKDKVQRLTVDEIIYTLVSKYLDEEYKEVMG
jgi:hypothetical protein